MYGVRVGVVLEFIVPGWLRALRPPAGSSFSSLSSLLTATSAFTWSFLSRRCRSSTNRRISRSSRVHSTIRSSSSVAWRCEPPASLSGATWSKSCSRPSPSFMASLSLSCLVHFKPALSSLDETASHETLRTRRQPCGTYHVLTVRHPSCRSQRWTSSSWAQACGRNPRTHRFTSRRDLCDVFHCCPLQYELLRDRERNFHDLLDNSWDALVHLTRGP